MTCSKYFYLLAAAYLEMHEYIMTSNLIHYKFLVEINENFAEYCDDYKQFLNLFFNSSDNNTVNQEMVDCFHAYCGAILVDCNFIVATAKREFLRIFEFLLENVTKEEIIETNPWSLYEETLNKFGIKEKGYK